jgi:hypothetical protein
VITRELYFQQNICIISWKETILIMNGCNEGVMFIYLCSYLFICSLFNSTVNSSGCIVLNGRNIGE